MIKYADCRLADKLHLSPTCVSRSSAFPSEGASLVFFRSCLHIDSTFTYSIVLVEQNAGAALNSSSSMPMLRRCEKRFELGDATHAYAGTDGR